MKKNIKIVLTGAESTGKTWLSRQLAAHFRALWLPEYAREYTEKLNRPYTYQDVEYIARKQVELERQISQNSKKIVFLDTDLIITKVWFLELYGKYPQWIDAFLNHKKDRVYLLCSNEIEWRADPVRENPDNRDYLLKRYEQEIENYSLTCRHVRGLANLRLENAIKIVEKLI